MALVGILCSALGIYGWSGTSFAAGQSITSAGPLTTITVSDVLNCSVNHTGDTRGEFYSNTACGTFLVVGGSLFGPTSVPAGESATSAAGYAPWTPVSQSAVTGAGTAADPYRITTVVDAGTTGIRVTEVDSYVAGQETYRTDVQVTNAGTTAAVRLYRAGDCFLQDSDNGFGRVDGAAISCVGVTQDGQGNNVPGDRIEQWLPLSSGSHYYHAGYDEVWQRIGDKLAFPDTCRCSEFIDNGAGLSWDFSAPSGATVTQSHLTSFSPAGIQPLTTTKTADQASVAAGGVDGYAITIHNPNTTAASIDAITDTLPSGFAYTAGSTTGATTNNPSVAGQNLSWNGPFSVPANGDVTLHFGVTASSTPGTYYNNAGGTGATAVAPTGNTAPVTVTAPATTTTTAGGATTTTTAGGGGTTTTTGGGGATTTTSSTPSTSTTSTSTTTSSTTTSTTAAPAATTTTAAPPTTTTTAASATTTTTAAAATTTTTTATSCSAAETVAAVDPTTARPGQTATSTDDCFAPGATLQARFESDPVFLGSVTADSSGRYRLQFVVPAAASSGTHHVVVTGPNPSGVTHRSVGTIRVDNTSVLAVSLPRTGSTGSRRLLTLAGILMMLGAGFVGVGDSGRRRRSPSAAKAAAALASALREPWAR